MAKAMTKSQVTENLAGKAGITKKAAGQFLDELASLAYKEAKNTFTLPGLGKLVLVNRKARMGRNPDRKSTRLNSSHGYISYAVFCLKKKKKTRKRSLRNSRRGTRQKHVTANQLEDHRD